MAAKNQTKLYAETILIGSQWHQNKTITIDDTGIICAMTNGLEEGAEVVEGAIIPGMVNCHSHAFQRAFAGLSEYRGNSCDSFWSWRDIMYQFVAKMTPEVAHKVAKYLYLEMLQAGYTTVAEFHYLHHQAGGSSYLDSAEMSHQVINAALDVGLAITHLPVLYTYAGFNQVEPSAAQARFIHQTDEYCQLLEKLNLHYKNHPTVGLGIAPHSLRAVSDEQLDIIIPLIRQIDANAPIHIHISEQLKEVEDCLAHYAKRPVEWLLENHTMDKNWCLVHATHLTEKEVSQLAKSGAVAGICPTTEANLGDGIYPTAEYMRLGGKLALGSDSHIAVNVADEIRTLEYGQRLTKHQRAVLVSNECASVGQYLYQHAAVNGANTVNQNVGEIAVGKRADLVVLDLNHPTLYAKKGSILLDAAIFACDKLPVKDVMVAGKWSLKNTTNAKSEQITKDYLGVMDKLMS
jgi:formimidoylglutamate deiminase